MVGVELTATLTDTEGGVSASGQITDEKLDVVEREDYGGFYSGYQWRLVVQCSFLHAYAGHLPIDLDDNDAGMYLRAMVSYTYQFGATEKMGTSDAILVQISTGRTRRRSSRMARVPSV